MKIPAGKKQRSTMGVVVGALVVAAIGVAGYLALARKPAPLAPPAPSPPQVGPTAAPPPAAAPVETVRVMVPPPAQPQRDNQARRGATPPPAPPAVATAQGYISVNSNPPGTLFIDGRDLGSVPVIEQPVSPGRHTIRVERAGYKTKTETIDVPANTTVRRTYVLEQEGPE
jgi:hypothetical protein